MNDISVEPGHLQRRSPVYRELLAAGGQFVSAHGGALAESFGKEIAEEQEIASRLGLCDITLLPHLGVKGGDALIWLRQQGLTIGDTDNRASQQGDGALAARLSPTEVMILSDPSGTSDLCAKLLNELPAKPGLEVFSVPRGEGYFWYLVSGEHAESMFAKICGVDLRIKGFAPFQIAQTSMARMNVIVIRDELGGIPAYYLLGDIASASYFWACLTDAMAEFKGRPIGHRVIRQLGQK